MVSGKLMIRFDLLSKYGREAFKNFYYAVLLNFKTQMSPGYNYPNDSVKISNFFLLPIYWELLEWIINQMNISVHLLLHLQQNSLFVNDKILSDAGAFGVTPGKKIKSEIGGYIRVIYSRNDFKNEFLKNVSFTTKIDLFSNYIDKPQNIDVNWETLIAMKVNKYLSVNFNTQLIYDDNIKIAV